MLEGISSSPLQDPGENFRSPTCSGERSMRSPDVLACYPHTLWRELRRIIFLRHTVVMMQSFPPSRTGAASNVRSHTQVHCPQSHSCSSCASGICPFRMQHDSPSPILPVTSSSCGSSSASTPPVQYMLSFTCGSCSYTSCSNLSCNPSLTHWQFFSL